MRAMARAFAQNPVFANIVLLLILFGGFLAASNMRRETFPDFVAGEIRVTVPYPGADPSEVEEGISRKIEEALVGQVGVKRVVTDSRESFAVATVTVEEEYDVREVLEPVRNRIDGIVTFPGNAEKPIVEQVVPRSLVLLVALAADMPERRLKRWAESVKEEILDLTDVSQVMIAGARDFEI